MDRYRVLQVFVAVVEELGFAAAARRLNMSPPAVTRAINTLEQRLKVTLLIRTTRVVRLTEAGGRYYDYAKRIMVEMDEADDVAAGINAAPSGQLTITAPVMFGKLYVMSVVTEYLMRYPDTVANTVFVDRVVNFVDEGIDIGVRIGQLPDSSLRAIRVGQVQKIICASPDYLNRCGKPTIPDELQQHCIITATGVSSQVEWDFIKNRSKQVVKIQSRLMANTVDSAIQAALSSFGLVQVLSYQVAAQLASGELVTVLDEFAVAPSPIHIIHRQGPHGSAKIRSFVDLVIERLRACSALNYSA